MDRESDLAVPLFAVAAFEDGLLSDLVIIIMFVGPTTKKVDSESVTFDHDTQCINYKHPASGAVCLVPLCRLWRADTGTLSLDTGAGGVIHFSMLAVADAAGLVRTDDDDE